MWRMFILTIFLFACGKGSEQSDLEYKHSALSDAPDASYVAACRQQCKALPKDVEIAPDTTPHVKFMISIYGGYRPGAEYLCRRLSKPWEPFAVSGKSLLSIDRSSLQKSGSRLTVHVRLDTTAPRLPSYNTLALDCSPSPRVLFTGAHGRTEPYLTEPPAGKAVAWKALATNSRLFELCKSR